jgi:2,3-diketo-5-methylthio-1-phosphopentane phosphatase
MSHAPPRLYLLDVEGTVAPISLIYEQLFPYARVHFSGFLEAHSDDSAVAADLALLVEENRAETEAGCPVILGAPGLDLETWESDNPSLGRRPEQVGRSNRVEDPAFRNTVLTYLLWLMDRDRKSTALKSLQGKIWKAGFESGELTGTVFPDVPGALARWTAHAEVAIYSSGSVDAQRLFFRHSSRGDLTPLIANYFDTRTGPKTVGTSYLAISAAMHVEPGETLFFSDVVHELDPAREAGCQTRLVLREGNLAVENAHGHIAVESFDAL